MRTLTEMHYHDMKTICQYCAVISFSYITSKSDGLIILGLYFTLFAALINFLLFAINTICAFYSKTYWKKYLLNSGLLLLNIPVVPLYIYLVLEISGF
ncbi:hypothetical protein [Flavobacterium urocaniciphilum]|uniref:Branched-chain amino acid:cation transporter, LIVCS family n=1 Tax=Flavobacterium urocaniciphilum TaxID=1299341 RepID=A0A1H8ZP53_9FLAO|nr:hypothetical protein [Flavobacterium urocaniciphilum]SEP66051.1 hypothetical protein SAMN05444005_101816 [Flavobacterium urocaniciphilum]